MADGPLVPFAEAYVLAEFAAEHLRPHVVRLKAVGSLRRRRDYVRDIEFLAVPRMVEADLFGTPAPDVVPVRKALEELGTWVQGAERAMRITEFHGRPGLQLEVYLVHPPASWFAQLCIRTGPWQLGAEAMRRMKKKGVGHRDGYPFDMKTGEPIELRCEADWFALAGFPDLAPKLRDQFADELEVQRVREGRRHG